ncbi:UbiA prenyltransferase family protein [Micromonospora echinofusca]|uniref:Prenyltransferase n=1 Tax=Micromonospora echinofusca TaxID=47858 RepID=A0ABS3VKE7_MICEH|nr:UbiA prenyltransferase family protein [Micromonospora echinofusca]MBO4204958.1 prenyltransferase [Micromonospora echinofusca]
MPAVDSLPVAGAPAVAPVPATRPRLLRDLIQLSRPTHWVKSLLVVPVPLLETPVWTVDILVRLGWAVGVFVLASSAVYVGNDLADRQRDRNHPVKRHRPIAAGRVPVPLAWLYCALLLGALAWLLLTGPPGHAGPVLGYLVLNVAYSRGLKHVPLVEAGAVALGFVLRVAQGYLATGGAVSGWLLVTVFAGCLLLVIGKRRQELLDSGPAHRPALRGYTVELAGHLVQLTSVLAVTAGLVYLRTEAPLAGYGEAAMLLSTPIVLYLTSRYLQLALVGRAAGDPVRLLLRDRAVLVTGLLWGVLLAGLLAAARIPALTALLP